MIGGQSLCLPQTCTTTVVKQDQTCYGIASAANITYTQLLSWNPTINGQCTNLITNQNICISQPGAAYTATLIPGATVTKSSPYASATVAAPGPTAHGTILSRYACDQAYIPRYHYPLRKVLQCSDRGRLPGSCSKQHHSHQSFPANQS